MLLCLWVKAWLLPALAAGAIAIEVPAEDREVAQGAVESCNETLGSTACRLASADEPAAAFYVHVAFFDSAKLEAQVEIRDRPDSDKFAVRHVAFAAADDLRQRYRALGLVVAAYVVGHPEPVAEPPPAPTPPPPPVAPPPTPVVPDRPPEPALSGGADLGALVGGGLDRGAPRFGLLLRGFARFRGLPVLPLLGVRLAYRAEQPALYWLSAEGGAAVEVTPQDALVGVAVRGTFVAERLIAQAEEAGEGSESGAKSRFGGRLGVDLFLRVSPGVWLFGGGDASLLAPRVHVDVGSEDAGQDPNLGWSASLGLRVAP